MNLREQLAARIQAQREELRVRESELLDAADALDPNDDSQAARYVREVAGQVRDHRAAGNYTTQG